MKLVIELYHSGGGSGNNVVPKIFIWSGFTQKRAQSTESHGAFVKKKISTKKSI